MPEFYNSFACLPAKPSTRKCSLSHTQFSSVVLLRRTKVRLSPFRADKLHLSLKCKSSVTVEVYSPVVNAIEYSGWYKHLGEEVARTNSNKHPQSVMFILSRIYRCVNSYFGTLNSSIYNNRTQPSCRTRTLSDILAYRFAQFLLIYLLKLCICLDTCHIEFELLLDLSKRIRAYLLIFGKLDSCSSP